MIQAKCEHNRGDYTIHAHPDFPRLTVRTCGLCGVVDWHNLWDVVVREYVLPAEESGRRAARGEPDDPMAAAAAVRSAARGAMFAGAGSSAAVQGWAREGWADALRLRAERLNRHRPVPIGTPTVWRRTTLWRGPVQVVFEPHLAAIRVFRAGLSMWWSTSVGRIPMWHLLTVVRYSRGWGLSVLRVSMAVHWWERRMPYDRPGTIRTPRTVRDGRRR